MQCNMLYIQCNEVAKENIWILNILVPYSGGEKSPITNGLRWPLSSYDRCPQFECSWWRENSFRIKNAFSHQYKKMVPEMCLEIFRPENK